MPELDSVKIEAHVQRLLRLESLFGATTRYELLDPFGVDGSDIVSIQHAAHRIRDFVGLRHITFIVAVTAQSESVAGQIELQQHGATEVYIEVAHETAASGARLLATLAHEIAHQVLQSGGVPPMDDREYEVFTDTAAVFFGLGKLMLNGRETTDLGPILANRPVTTTSYTTGYLSLSELALVYHFVCTMRQIPKGSSKAGLCPAAFDGWREAAAQHDSKDSFRMGQVDSALAETLCRVTDKAQLALSDIQSLMTFLRASVHDTTERVLRDTHDQLHKTAEAVAYKSASELDPCMRYLKALENDLSLRRRAREIESCLDQLGEMRREALILARVAERCSSFPQPDEQVFGNVPCGRCGTVLRLPIGMDSRKTHCPSCSYVFYAKTTAPLRARKGYWVCFRELGGFLAKAPSSSIAILNCQCSR